MRRAASMSVAGAGAPLHIIAPDTPPRRPSGESASAMSHALGEWVAMYEKSHGTAPTMEAAMAAMRAALARK